MSLSLTSLPLATKSSSWANAVRAFKDVQNGVVSDGEGSINDCCFLSETPQLTLRTKMRPTRYSPCHRTQLCLGVQWALH
ncbi:hypothetical protein EMCRGX_G019813 [Ephydatia muelleri]